MPRHVLARAVIVRDGRVLLIQRSDAEELGPGQWQCPAGTQEAGETIEETLAREVREETGFVVTDRRPLGETATVLPRDGARHEWTQHDFLVAALGDAVTLSHEHQAFEWSPLDEAAGRVDLSPQVRVALERAIEAIRAGGDLG